MANILIIDNQQWVLDLCKDGYLINNCLAPVELKQKITVLLNREH